MSEIVLQNMENEHFHNITGKHKIRQQKTRYVDDILVFYDSITRNENDILNDLNSIHSKIKFIHENEIDKTINYFGLTHNKKPTKESNRFWNLSQTKQQHNSNPPHVKTSIPTKIKHIQ